MNPTPPLPSSIISPSNVPDPLPAQAAVREKDEMIKALKSKDRRSREITSQLRQRVLAERDANSSLQLQVTEAKGKAERSQVGAHVTKSFVVVAAAFAAVAKASP